MKNNSTGAVIGAERKGAVAWITLNRPQALNAIDDEMREQLPAALREADEHADVRVIVIHGAGDRAFCAGADLASHRFPPAGGIGSRLAPGAVKCRNSARAGSRSCALL